MDPAKALRLVAGSGGGIAEQSRIQLLAQRLPDDEQAWRTSQLNYSGLNTEAIAALVRVRALFRVRQGCYVRTA